MFFQHHVMLYFSMDQCLYLENSHACYQRWSDMFKICMFLFYLINAKNFHGLLLKVTVQSCILFLYALFRALVTNFYFSFTSVLASMFWLKAILAAFSFDMRFLRLFFLGSFDEWNLCIRFHHMQHWVSVIHLHMWPSWLVYIHYWLFCIMWDMV